MTLDHEAEVENALAREREVAERVRAEQDRPVTTAGPVQDEPSPRPKGISFAQCRERFGGKRSTPWQRRT